MTEEIVPGRIYCSQDESGEDREVLKLVPPGKRHPEMVEYRVTHNGPDRIRRCSLEKFKHWAVEDVTQLYNEEAS